MTEHHLEFLSLTGGCRGSSESTHVKIPHCLKSHAAAHILLFIVINTFSNVDCNGISFIADVVSVYHKI